MIDILIDCANKEIRVTRNGEEYLHAKVIRSLATTAIIAWQLVHDLSHELDDDEVNYFGVTPDNRNVNCKVDIKAQAFCMLMDNFGSTEDLVTSQTNLAIQLLIHGSTLSNKNKEKEGNNDT